VALRLRPPALERRSAVSYVRLRPAHVPAGRRVGVNADTLQGWCKQAERCRATPSDDHQRRQKIKQLEAEGAGAEAR
jgi:hypothetical protein